MEWMGDERDVLLGSGQHLAGGGRVVTVPDDDGQDGGGPVLAAHGGRETAHFGKGHWEPIGP